MKKYIKCSNCGHNSFTRFGLVIKARTIYYLNSDYIRSPRFTPEAKKLTPGSFWVGIQALSKAGDILGFYCLGCNKLFPKKMTKEILEYFRQKNILSRLKD